MVAQDAREFEHNPTSENGNPAIAENRRLPQCPIHARFSTSLSFKIAKLNASNLRIDLQYRFSATLSRRRVMKTIHFRLIGSLLWISACALFAGTDAAPAPAP